jgi:hypothetical protein
MAGRDSREPAADFAFFLHDPARIREAAFALTPDEITLLNPNTGTCPIFRTRRDAEITLGVYRQTPVLSAAGDVKFERMLDITNDSDAFLTAESLVESGFRLMPDGVFRRNNRSAYPLYEGKMVAFWDHRAADVVTSATAAQRQRQPRYLSDADHRDPWRVAQPAYWVSQTRMTSDGLGWQLGFSNITSPTNERTFTPAPLPPAGVANSLPLIRLRSDPWGRASLLACLSSFALDFVARQKVGGVTMNFFIVEQLPVLSSQALGRSLDWAAGIPVSKWLSTRALELVYTAWDMAPFAEDLGDTNASGRVNPPFVWDDERRFWLRAELDAAFFHLYGIARDDVDYIMDTFPIVRRKDEAAHGEYRTKRVILELFDAMQTAIDTGVPYTSPITPPPGHGPRHPDGRTP